MKERKSRERRAASKSGLARICSICVPHRRSSGPGGPDLRHVQRLAGRRTASSRLLLLVVAVEGDLDRAPELPGLDRFEEEAVRLRLFRFREGRFVRMGRQVDDGHSEAGLQELGGLDPVELALYSDVEDDDVRTALGGPGECFVGGRGDGVCVVAEVGEGLLEIVRDDALVLDDEHRARFGMHH